MSVEKSLEKNEEFNAHLETLEIGHTDAFAIVPRGVLDVERQRRIRRKVKDA